MTKHSVNVEITTPKLKEKVEADWYDTRAHGLCEETFRCVQASEGKEREKTGTVRGLRYGIYGRLRY